jgi:hypothetical protein
MLHIVVLPLPQENDYLNKKLFGALLVFLFRPGANTSRDILQHIHCYTACNTVK